MPLMLYRQSDPEAVTMDQADSTRAAAHARVELAAMQGIADLLARLPDAAARNRVLQWVEGVFHQAEPETFLAAAPPLHIVWPVAIQESKVAVQDDSDLSVGSMEDWFENDDTPPADDRFPQVAKTQPVVSMIHGFVADFQKLARDWQV
jgi:hypothetical protein